MFHRGFWSFNRFFLDSDCRSFFGEIAKVSKSIICGNDWGLSSIFFKVSEIAKTVILWLRNLSSVLLWFIDNQYFFFDWFWGFGKISKSIVIEISKAVVFIVNFHYSFMSWLNLHLCNLNLRLASLHYVSKRIFFDYFFIQKCCHGFRLFRSFFEIAEIVVLIGFGFCEVAKISEIIIYLGLILKIRSHNLRVLSHYLWICS